MKNLFMWMLRGGAPVVSQQKLPTRDSAVRKNSADLQTTSEEQVVKQPPVTYTGSQANATPEPEEQEQEESFDDSLRNAQSWTDLETLWDDADEDSPNLSKILAVLEGMTISFSDLLEAYSNRSNTDKFSDILLTKAISLAESPDDWNSLWEEANDNEEEDSKKVIAALRTKTYSHETWKQLRDIADSESEIESLAFIKLVDFCTDVQSIITFYLECDEDYTIEEEVETAIFKKLFSLATRQEIQIIYMLTDKDNLRDAADTFLKS